jgi:hypothetical protein
VGQEVVAHKTAQEDPIVNEAVKLLDGHLLLVLPSRVQIPA